ncbi:MAG: hypothetical protein RLZZ262_1934, partial [Bacteroidota bacterium]
EQQQKIVSLEQLMLLMQQNIEVLNAQLAELQKQQ